MTPPLTLASLLLDMVLNKREVLRVVGLELTWGSV